MPTSSKPKSVVVAGATGRLGTIVDALLAGGHSVGALTRDPGSPAAERLRRLGAEIVRADFDDRQSIAAAAAGADALFATGTAHRAGPEGELRHGLNVAGAAANADVGHLVYVSGDGAARTHPLPLFRAKFEVEERIRSLPTRHTILAPVYFMDNLFNPWNLAPLRLGQLPSPIPIDQPLQQAAIADVVGFAAHVVEHPEAFAGRRIAIASDELSAGGATTALAGVIDRELEPVELDRTTLPPGLQALFAWLEDVGHAVDIHALHRRYPEIGWHDFGAWAQSQRHRFRELCPHSVAASARARSH